MRADDSPDVIPEALPPDPADRLPPHDLSAELSTLGSLVLCDSDRVLFGSVRRLLSGKAFYSPDHQIVYDALLRLFDAGVAINPITLRAELQQRGLYDEVGGREFMASMLGCVPTPAHGEHFARLVAERARERHALKVATRLIQRMYEPRAEDSRQIIQRAIEALWRTANAGRDMGVWTMADAARGFLAARQEGKSPALDTGIEAIDEFRGLLTLGGYTVIAGRPSMGKSTLARHIALTLAKAGTRVGLVAVEENRDKIAGNALSSESSITNDHVAYGRWSSDEAEMLAEIAASFEGLPYFGIDTAMNQADVLAAVEMLATQHHCRVIFVDHIHLIQAGSAENRTQQLNELSAALKAAFKRLGVAGVVLAQLSRPPKHAGIPDAPQLSDLRESGAIEEHADAVLMIHRPDYYRRDRPEECDGLAEIHIRKNRNGPVGMVEIEAELEYQRFGHRPVTRDRQQQETLSLITGAA